MHVHHVAVVVLAQPLVLCQHTWRSSPLSHKVTLPATTDARDAARSHPVACCLPLPRQLPVAADNRVHAVRCLCGASPAALHPDCESCALCEQHWRPGLSKSVPPTRPCLRSAQMSGVFMNTTLAFFGAGGAITVGSYFVPACKADQS